MTSFEQNVVKVGLVKLLSHERYFSICQLESCLKVSGIVPPHQVMETLRCLHCIDYALMTPQLRRELYETVLGLFSADTELIQLRTVILKLDLPDEAPKERRLFGLLPPKESKTK